MPDKTTLKIKTHQFRDINTKGEFLHHLKIENGELASFYENKKWEDEAENIENERFQFGDQYSDYWFNCLVRNEKSECTSFLAIVTYQEGGLKQSNP